jgi:hypothetical protein
MECPTHKQTGVVRAVRLILLLWLSLAGSTLTRADTKEVCRPPTGVNCDDPRQWKLHYPVCACTDLRYADPRFSDALTRWKQTYGPGRSDPSPSKGIFGYESPPQWHPSAVKVESRSKPGRLCSGVLISSKAVLTAGHCVAANIGVSGDVVTFGPMYDDARPQPSRISPQPSTSAIDRLDAFAEAEAPRAQVPGARFVDRKVAHVLHQQYREDNSIADFAILLLTEKAPVPPAQIARTEDVESAIAAHAVGFGLTEKGAIGSKVFVEQLIVSKNCAGWFVHQFTNQRFDDSSAYGCLPGQELVTAGFVDVGAPRISSDTCVGDSGGPLFVLMPFGQIRKMDMLVGLTARAVDTRYFPAARTNIVASGLGQVRCGSGGIYTAIAGPTLTAIENSLNRANEQLGN